MIPALTVQELSPHVTRFIVPTPTLPPAFHTNSYLIVHQQAGLLVDFGTHDQRLLEQAADELRARNLARLTIAATHYHRDHTHGLGQLATWFDAPIYVHEADLVAAASQIGVAPARLHQMPASFQIGEVTVTVQHLPGHTHGHVHLRVEPDSVLLVGDHLAGSGSVWVGPPDGHLSDYLAALDAIISAGCEMAAPGHGEMLVPAADAALRLKQRRLLREEQIANLLRQSLTQHELVDTLYGDTVPPQARWVAERTVQGHLQRLIELGRIERQWQPTRHCFTYHLN